MIYQRTLKKTISATGVGLHSGEKVSICLRPAAPDSGIVFRRTDLDSASGEYVTDLVAAKVENVSDTRWATSLSQNGVVVSTVEHLLAAFAGLGIDNAVVDLDAPELPIMDGSASPFVFLIQSAGVELSSVSKKFIRILKEIKVEEAGVSASLSPYDGFRLEYTLEYDHPVFRRHSRTSCVEFSTQSFVKEIARARTFGFLADFEQLRSMDLVRGGSLDNAVVIDEFRILNEDGLRQEDEFVKHKMLDAMGDLYLLGHNIVGSFCGIKSGHSMNHLLLQQILAQPESWEMIDYVEVEKAPVSFTRPTFA